MDAVVEALTSKVPAELDGLALHLLFSGLEIYVITELRGYTQAA